MAIYSIKICERVCERARARENLYQIASILCSLILLQICRVEGFSSHTLHVLYRVCAQHVGFTVLQINPRSWPRNIASYHNQYKSKASTTLRCQSQNVDKIHSYSCRCTRILRYWTLVSSEQEKNIVSGTVCDAKSIKIDISNEMWTQTKGMRKTMWLSISLFVRKLTRDAEIK